MKVKVKLIREEVETHPEGGSVRSKSYVEGELEISEGFPAWTRDDKEKFDWLISRGGNYSLVGNWQIVDIKTNKTD